jgi:predicted O-methyltransferase YrrM
MDPRLNQQKQYPRAMKSYVLMLYEFVREIKPNKVLELGTQNGQSTKTILMAMGMNNYGTLVTVDHKDRLTILDAEYSDLKKYCIFIKGNTHSPETLQTVKNQLSSEELFDILFIDAGHSYEDVKSDFNDYGNLVKSGGLILLHDTVNTDAGINKFFQEISYEKFNITWGWSRRRGLIPGMGIVRKP